MKIVEMHVHSIAIADPPLRSSYGLHAPYALRTILELKSEDGIIGIAETYGGEAPVKALEDLRERIVGSDAYGLTGILSGMVSGKAGGADRSQSYLVPGENPMDAQARTYSAIETACLDLIGKSVGQPVCELLGGRIRDEVSFSAYAFYKHAGGGGEWEDKREDFYGEALTSDDLVKQVQRMIELYGFGSVKLKGGVLEPAIEIETIKQLHRTIGRNIPLRIDPNSAWSVDTSVMVGKSLAVELGGRGYLEDPVVGLENMSEVRRRLLSEGIETPLASNVAVTCFEDIPKAVELDAVQIILCDHHYWGGMREVQHLAKMASVFGIELSMHSNSHLGVSLMAMAHVAAATPNLNYACDTHYPHQSGNDEIVVGGRIPINNGRVKITDRPGLGVELDYDQLARVKELYKKVPYRCRDDEKEMQNKVDPDWKRVLPRW